MTTLAEERAAASSTTCNLTKSCDVTSTTFTTTILVPVQESKLQPETDDIDNDDNNAESTSNAWSFGHIYIMWSLVDILKRLYIGMTRMSLKIRKSMHMCACKHGQSKIYVAMRDLGRESFRMKEVTLVPFPPGTTTAEKMKILRVMETQEIDRHDPATLFNTSSEENVSNCAAILSRRTSQDDMIVSERTKRNRNDRGHVEHSSVNSWRFRWTVDHVTKRKTFVSLEAAIAYQDSVFKKKAITPDASRSFIYRIISPHLKDNLKIYTGKTIMRYLFKRLGDHRAQIRSGATPFYRFMGDNEPLKWEIIAIHTLYGVSNKELLAIEAMEIAKIPSELRWNSTPNHIILSQRLWYNEHHYTCKKGQTVEEFESKMNEIVTNDGGDITKIKINKSWVARVCFGGTTYKKCFSFTKHGGEVKAKTKAEAWLNPLLTKRLKWQTKIANAAIKRSKALEALAAVHQEEDLQPQVSACDGSDDDNDDK